MSLPTEGRPGVIVRPLAADDGEWARRLFESRWGSDRIVSRGRVYDLLSLPGFVAVGRAGLLGLATYRIENDECELTSLDALDQLRGVGTALLEAVSLAASQAACRRLWLITTNDNLQALRFYQRRGFRLTAVHREALRRSRELKPEIPAVGRFGIPLRDELELELLLVPEAA